MAAATGAPSTANRALELDNEDLYEALDRLVRAYQFRDRQRVCYHGLSVNTCYTLQILVWHDGLTQNELAAEMRLDKSTTSRILVQMEADGHIRRSRDPEDGRAQRLHVTASGKRLHQRIRRDLLDRQLGLISDLSSESRRAAVAVLRRLADMAVRSYIDSRPVGSRARPVRRKA